jgi:ABC-type bacteriocin/lantibiotic exporter with double-glycine peptidase domain
VVSPIAAGVLIFIGMVLSLILRPVRRAARTATDRTTIAQRDVAEHIGQVHDLAQEIRVHDSVDAIEGGMRRSARVLTRARRQATLVTSLGSVLYRTVGLGFVLAAAIFVSGQTELDLARVGVAGLLLLRSIGYGQSIQNAWQQIENNRPYSDRVAEALETYAVSTPKTGTKPIAQLSELTLKDVSYAYDDSAPLALDSIDLAIGRGETLGIVGPSGGGKSTLVQVLLGLRQPTSGLYTTGGVSCDDVVASDWFRLVTVVPQQPQLLRASVMENIKFFREWISDERARDAARQAGLHDEIVQLPEAYDTQVGDAIRDLSGGQRQRMGIARALAGSPQLLVLDEPTSALDAMSEARIQETLLQLKGNVTVVIIAHRLATLNHCDRILVLEGGKNVALDRASLVVEQNEFFREATRLQLVDVGE